MVRGRDYLMREVTVSAREEDSSLILCRLSG